MVKVEELVSESTKLGALHETVERIKEELQTRYKGQLICDGITGDGFGQCGTLFGYGIAEITEYPVLRILGKTLLTGRNTRLLVSVELHFGDLSLEFFDQGIEVFVRKEVSRLARHIQAERVIIHR